MTGLPEPALGAMTGRILPPLSAILPLWLVRSMVGWRETRRGLAGPGRQRPARSRRCSSTGRTTRNRGWSTSSRPWSRSLAMVAFLKVWRPRTILPVTTGTEASTDARDAPSALGRRRAQGLVSLPAGLGVHLPLRACRAVSKHLTCDGPETADARAASRGPADAAGRAGADARGCDRRPERRWRCPGTAVFAGGRRLGAAAGHDAGCGSRGSSAGRCVQLAPSLLAISFMVGLAFVTRYSGMDTVLGLSLTRTGPAFPFFGTLLGWLGVALTGTDAGSNALFGNLQKVTAERLGLSPILMAAANSSGGVMGKMIDAQSIVVASTATQQVGREAEIFQAVLEHSLALVCLVGLIVMLYAFVFPDRRPSVELAQSLSPEEVPS